MTDTNQANKEKGLYDVNIVPSETIADDEILVVSGAKMTHEENLTTGEKKKIISWIDSIRIKNVKPPNQSNKDKSL